MADVSLRMAVARTTSGGIDQYHLFYTIVLLIILVPEGTLTYVSFHIVVGTNLKRWQ